MAQASIFERRMRYLCLIYVDPARLNALTGAEKSALLEEALAYHEALRKSGHYVDSAALQPAEAATTLRVRDGRLSITDGPFAETKEFLGGVIVIEARDLNEAMHVAAKIPPGRVGAIEVRPVRDVDSASARDAAPWRATRELRHNARRRHHGRHHDIQDESPASEDGGP